MLDARQIKSPDEIMLLTQAAAMVDGVYQDIVEVLKPGIRENEIVALANKRLYEMGSDQVEAVNAVSGERCNPHPHNFSDRLIRPGDQAFFDIIHSYNGYRTCYYRTFSVGSATASQRDAYTKAREWMDAAIAAVKPGVGTDEIAAVLAAGDRVRLRERDGRVRPAVRPRARARAARAADHLPAEQHAGARSSCRPGWSSRWRRTARPSDGFSAARIEEEVVVTADGPRILTLFPAQDLVVANPLLRRSHGRHLPPTSSSAASGCRPSRRRPLRRVRPGDRARSSPRVADGTVEDALAAVDAAAAAAARLGRDRAAGSGPRSCAARSS